MVLYLNSVLQANLPVGVSCIEGRSLEMGGSLYSLAQSFGALPEQLSLVPLL